MVPPARTRTSDRQIRRLLLYPLSYGGEHIESTTPGHPPVPPVSVVRRSWCVRNAPPLRRRAAEGKLRRASRDHLAFVPGTVLLRPSIPTGGRPTLPTGRNPAGMLLGLSVVPAIGFAVAAFDTRLGFRLIMASVGLIMCVMIVALLLLPLARSAARGDPHRRDGRAPVCPSALRTAPGLSPSPLAAAPGGRAVLGSRGRTADAGELLTVHGVGTVRAARRVRSVSLALIAWSMRVPVGLRVGPSGISGVRGNGALNLDWGDIASASPVGEYGGPKLGLVTSAGDAVSD